MSRRGWKANDDHHADVGYDGHQADAWNGPLCHDCGRPARGRVDPLDPNTPRCSWCSGVHQRTETPS